MSRHFISQTDLTRDEIHQIFDRTRTLKEEPRSALLKGRTLVMFFEKASTRTRLSFEIGMTQLDGHAVYLDRDSSQLSRGESIRDTAEVISRYADVMMARVYSHRTVQELARYARVPVINGLSDEEHPCQSMADLYTVLEHKGSLQGLRLAYFGDGDNNVCHSLMLACAQLGVRMIVASPPELQPDGRYVEMAREQGGSVSITADPEEAAQGADVLYTDVWVSMGQEKDRERRLSVLEPYQVNAEIAGLANDGFIFMHCLPAHVGEEATEDVAYGPSSVIFDQAENRLHVQKALMLFLLGR